MGNNLIGRIHLLLMEKVDGNAADQFSAHLGEWIGDVTAYSDSTSQADQIRWMAHYWCSQLNNETLDVHGVANNLFMCRDTDQFMNAFDAVIIPVLIANPHLPIATLPIAMV